MKRLLFPLLAILLASTTAAMALTVTSGTLTLTRAGDRGGLERLDLDWATEIHSGKVRATGIPVEGRIERLVVDSDVGTSVQVPTNGYDVFLRDLDGIDVITNAGVAADPTATPEQHINASETAISTGTFLQFSGPLSLEIDDTGTTPSRLGRIRLYYRR